eukprot:m.15713 g.15713  ORF g.15713 m.15713 type:complete len:266 (-) comp5076_c1_seq1:2011-2808(-)
MCMRERKIYSECVCGCPLHRSLLSTKVFQKPLEAREVLVNSAGTRTVVKRENSTTRSQPPKRTMAGRSVLLSLLLAGVLLGSLVCAEASDGDDSDEVAVEVDDDNGGPGIDLASPKASTHEHPDPPAHVFTKGELAKMRTKELRAMLSDRGVQCNGCAEKTDLVERVLETQHLPLKYPPPPPEHVPNVNYDDIMAALEKDREKQDKLRESLRAQGIDVDNVQFGNGMGSEAMEHLMRNLKKQQKATAHRQPKEKAHHKPEPHVEL